MPQDRDERDPGLPIKLGPCSNGEFAPLPPSEVVREAVRRARADCDENARRIGMSRRRFLLSSCGAATTLLALAACSQESGESTGGGTFSIPPEATTDTTAAAEVLGGDEPIIDVQTHLLEYDLSVPAEGGFWGDGFPQAACGEGDARACFSTSRWMEEIFLKSDTTVAVLSAIPIVGEANPLSIEVMEEARRVATGLCGDGRVLIQGHAWPAVGPVEAALAAMEEIHAAHPIAAWKVYTHAGGAPWSLDDHDPSTAPVGARFLAKVEELGPGIVAVHKGFSGGSRHASPVDIGPAAKAHPGIAIVVYHSGYEPDVDEGPYDPAGGGVDRLVASLAAAGIGPGANVYAELGSTWKLLLPSPDQAAHVLGKLLVAVGEDNVLWGSDSIWYGSPMDQIQAFRAFEISAELQERFGYPALTPAVKAKILGGNAARLYGIDPASVPCAFDRAELEQIRYELPTGNRTYGPRTADAARATFRRDHPWIA